MWLNYHIQPNSQPVAFENLQTGNKCDTVYGRKYVLADGIGILTGAGEAPQSLNMGQQKEQGHL